MWNTILFDLDGTLTDSGEGITKCVQYALSKGFGIEVDDRNDLRCFIGPPMKKQLMSFANLTDEQAEYALELYRERYRPVGVYENRVYDGIEELLKKLEREHFLLAVASSKPTVFCRQILEHFGLAKYFAVIVGSGIDGARATKADVLEETIRLLGKEYDKDQVVLIGDTKYDINGAKQVGIDSIGVTFGFGTREELEAAWPEVIVDTPEEIWNVIYGQFRAAAVPNKKGKLKMPRTGTNGFGGGFFPATDRSIIRSSLRVVSPVVLDVALSLAVSFLLNWGVFMLSELGAITYDAYASFIEGLWPTLILDALIIPIMYHLFKKDEMARYARSQYTRLPLENENNPRSILMLAVFSFAVSQIANLVLSLLSLLASELFGFTDTAYEAVQEALFESSSLPVEIIAIAVIGPIAEELVFRGLVYRRIRDYLGAKWAIVLSSLMFGIFHGNISQGIYAFALGMLLAAVYEHTGTLWSSIAAHMLINLVAVILTAVLLHTSDNTGAVISGLVYVAAAAVIVLMRKWIFPKNKRINYV